MKSDLEKRGKIRGENTKLNNKRPEKSKSEDLWPVARGGCGTKAPPLAARSVHQMPRKTVCEKR